MTTKVTKKNQNMLSNKTDDYVAFEVKTTNPRKYCVRPNTGIVLPRSTCDIIGLLIADALLCFKAFMCIDFKHRMMIELHSQGVTIEEIEEVEPEDSFTSQGVI
ncbi:hypothetical protein QN277_023954 [Acacia crassicarpa]|uniref:MSP domain-containing protein n=2 Tax=Acacia crassicarpa TaxID=499986 RepID=A0AAE1MJL6_9FABA|nr:hypothetical protein QN277_023954 [Acacia crassicarpa]